MSENGGKTALEVANDLVTSLDENTDAVDRLRRRYRLTMVLLAMVAFSLVSVIKFNYDGNVSRCESGNELRTEIDTKFQSVADSLVQGGIEDTPEGVAFVKLLSTDLEPRNCSDINWLGR